MEINRNNYIIFVLDYLEGNLPESEMKSFQDFLDKNPDILQEVEGIGKCELIPADITFPGKQDLLKKIILINAGISYEEFQDLCIAWHEGDMDPARLTSLRELIGEDPERQKTFSLLGKVYLEADPNIVYIDKLKLKKLPQIIRIRKLAISFISSAAAILVLSLLIFNPELIKSRFLAEHNNHVNDSNQQRFQILEDVNESVINQAVTLDKEENEYDKKDNQRLLEARPAGTAKKGFADNTEPNKEVFPAAIRNENNILSIIQPIKNIEIPVDWQIEKKLSLPVQNRSIDDGYLSLPEFISEQFFQRILKEPEGTDNYNDHILLSLAESGLEELNKLSDGTIAFNREQDDNGNVRRITFETPIFGFSAPVNQHKAIE